MEVTREYKQTEVGVIPNNWYVKKLGTLLRVIGGGAFRSSDGRSSGIKWLKISNVGINRIIWDDESYLPCELVKENEKLILKENDYVIALTRPLLDRKLKIAKLEKYDVPALLNQRVGKIQVESGTDIGFAYYLFQKFETINALIQSMAGTDPPNLGNQSLYNINCAVPPTIEEQTAIATALSDTDALISSLEKLIAKKRNIKQGAMQELLKPKKGWKMKTIQNLIDENFIIGHLDGNHGELYPRSHEFQTSGVPYIGATDFDNGKIDFHNCKYLSFERAKVFKKGISVDGDVLFAHNATVGPVALVKTSYKYIIISTTATYFRCNNNKLNSSFLFYLMQADGFVNQYQAVMLQSTRAQVPIGQQRKFKVDLPPLEEQEQIADILTTVDNEIRALERKLSKYKKIKSSMMQSLLTGKIRLV